MLPRVLTVAVIPARAGSQGLPGKHVRLLGGDPVIAHSIRAAAASRRIDRVLVSTNDPAVARIAVRIGAEVPFLRPQHLSEPDTPTVHVIQHAIAWLEQSGALVGLVVTLQATSPLRTAHDIDSTIALLEDPAVRSAATVAHLDRPISVVGSLEGGRYLPARGRQAEARRQSAPPAVRLTGGVYVTRRDLLAEGRLLDDRPAAFLVERASAIDIDTADDLAEARRAIRRRGA